MQPASGGGTDQIVFTFLCDGTFLVVDKGDHAADPCGQSGLEWGTYTWNAATGAFTFAVNARRPGGTTGTPGADVLVGTTAADVLTGLAGNDILDGGASVERLQFSDKSINLTVGDAARTVTGAQLTRWWSCTSPT